MTGIKKGSGKMTINDKIINWIADRVEHDYAEDIALILLYGSYVNGTANAKSDVDCYFIPRTERGYEFSADFIIQGVGYDIFPKNKGLSHHTILLFLPDSYFCLTFIHYSKCH